MTTVLKKLSALALLALAGNAVNAATATGTLAVTATVTPRCSLAANPTLAFPNYVSTAGNVTANATIEVTCASGTATTVGLDGLAGGVRTMDGQNVGEVLEFNLYKDAGFTQVWDNSGGGLLSHTHASGAPVNHTVYGRIVDNAANQAQPAGNYTRNIGITVTW